ncbi:hypothetical protein MNV49_005691 [Pseudohyphozyma bogoriensis]|nr:hypothetical protein MNV49_005691 [Pseudohyphozyma bogoriensis]
MSEEQEFKIQPHPATDNIDRDSRQAEPTAGLGGAPNLSHLHDQGQKANPFQAKGPHVPAKELAEGLEKPKTREELQEEKKKFE